ncbi:Alpha/beta hydrolase fold-3 [Penicillium expansum]|nr:Alpha/beta hydrolase fold-3 [Penicillium expansum]KGO58707.1 Alpha/beta hydrolase fold-3 [Penicillium expansum]
MEFDDEMGYAVAGPGSSRSNSRPPRPRCQAPQEFVKQFWEQFNTKYPGKVYTVLPDNPYARTRAKHVPSGRIQGHEAVKSYEQARQECEKSVCRIVKECERVNQKYSDPHFDIELDLKCGRRHYLDGLDKPNNDFRPQGVKRVTEIFENPQFFVNGPTASDVRQGYDGDCWLMAALCTMGNKAELIEKICVARNEDVGIYGFVFHRDGEWQQCIIDDKLYLRAADYDESVTERPLWDDINRNDTEEEYRRVWQTGSRALYFAQCVDDNETWLPLLEKAFAKAHGDYSAIEGGFVGEALEDLTGGVTSEVLSSNILNKDRFWTEEIMKVNKEFLFGCGTGLFSNWLEPSYHGPPRDRKGIAEGHSYSIMDAREIDGHRLLRLRNPWGRKEWYGAWGDGSKEWTPEWMEKLGHKFGNDGLFWISYKDLLKKYQHFDRTRLFGPEWTITQQWTTLNVPWSADYHSTKFMMDVTTSGPVVIVLSQLDARYFKGLAGEYSFVLKFRLQKDGEQDYLVRSHNSHFMGRSVNAEIDLDPGRYHVLMKITAFRHEDVDSTEEIVRQVASTRREKLVQVGLSYDLAHAKGLVGETEQEKHEQELLKAAERKKLRDEIKKNMQKDWIRNRKLSAREERRKARCGSRTPSGSSYDHNPECDYIPSQILKERPVEESPIEAASISSESSDRRVNGSVPIIHVNGGQGLHARQASSGRLRGADSPRPSLDVRFATDSLDPSDLELLEGFEFDSDVDMPPDEADVKNHPPLMDRDEPALDPWNAVCVVGLRVYSKDPMLSLQVVRPVPEDDTEAPLDRDDPAASATTSNKANTPILNKFYQRSGTCSNSAMQNIICSSRGIALVLRRSRGATRIFVACFQSSRYSTASSDCTDETISLPIGNNGAISLRITRPSALSWSQQGQSPKDPNVILYLPPGPLFQGNGTSESQKHGNFEVDHQRTGDTNALASAAGSPQHVLASTASALVVTVNYRLGDKQTPISPSSDEISISQESIESSDQTPEPINPQLTSYKYPTPVHDTLAGFDWIQTNLRPSQLAIFGTHIGGSLALMLALTEAQSIQAVAAVEPVCDWPGLDEYCTRESTITPSKKGADNTTPSTTITSKHKRQPRKKSQAPPDLVPLLQARSKFFSTPERYFDSFASPILFLRSAGRDVPRTFPQYLTGPEYPVPVLKEKARSTTAAEQHAASDRSIWDRDVYPDMDADDVDDISGTVTRRRKALSRWPPYGLDYRISGNTWSGPGDGIGRLEMALPWVRVFLREGSAGLASDSSSSSVTELKKKTREGGHGSTVIARQADEMVSAMRRACFWGREKGVGERRVTLSQVQRTDGNEGEEVGDWFKDVFEGTMEDID